MNHEDALREMAVERYLLGELSDEPRDRFEEHFFECGICAADLKAGVVFAAAVKEEPRHSAASRETLRVMPQRNVMNRLRPWLLIPALAASLLVLIYQNTLVLPGMRQAVARAEAPAVLNNLVLANINARGDAVPEITAPTAGSFLISVDIPLKSGISSYLCSLYGPSGALLWQVPVALQQAENTVSLRVPVEKSAEGLNLLVVRGIPATGSGNAEPIEVGKYQFKLRAQP